MFIAYHHNLAGSLTAVEVLKLFYYGVRMDASFTGYICILPFLLFFISSVFPRFKSARILYVYTVALVILFSFLNVADLELYTAWGFRMDATPLQYFSNPAEMGATVSSAPVILLLLLWMLSASVFIFIYKKYFYYYGQKQVARVRFADVIISLFLIAFLFIPIRGGIQKIPMNISDVYFSEKMFANHAAVNLPWNVMFSLLNRGEANNPFDYFTLPHAQELVAELYESKDPQPRLVLNTDRPNIIVIILESFTAKLVGCLGAEKGVTPQLDKIAAEGLLFTNIYAAGDRSEKGQIGILSAYPNQAITSIIKTPTKTRALPSINQQLEQYGYQTSFTYGGELEFANIKSYLLNTGFDQLTDKYDFPLSQRTTSWGVHDGYVFNKFYDELSHKKDPFFATLFTLSSHEPYDVPIHHFNGKDETSQFKNSVYYTDSVLGKFIEQSKAAPWWNNTLIVLVADHGHPLPGHDANDRASKFHIPLIFAGGALEDTGRITKIGSQTDIVPTLLSQLHLPVDDFKWGKDLLDSASRSFAFYSFNNGFGIVTPSGAASFDNVSKKLIYKDPAFDTSLLKYGKAYMQFSYEDYLSR